MICGFLWGRNVAGFTGAVTTGLLNAVWFELVYFYTHPLSESFASAALVAGLYLIYPGRNVWSERQMFIGAAALGLAAVLRPQLVPVIAVAVVAVGGIRLRSHYPALLGGLALSIVLSGLLDWITWGWPFHATLLYVYYSAKVSSAAGLNPFYSYFGWEGVAWGLFGVVIVLCALYGAIRLPLLLWVAALIFIIHSAFSHKEYRYISPALPLIMTLAGVGSAMVAESWQIGSANLGSGARCWSPCRSAGPSPPSPWRLRRTADGSGFDLAGRSLRCKRSTRTRKPVGSEFIPADMWWRAAGYSGLRPGVPLFNAGETANPIAPNAYNYVISLQQRSRELQHPVDLPADFAGLGYQQIQCWTDPYDRTMLPERMCLWQPPGDM